MQVQLLLQQNNRLIPGLLELSLLANGFKFFFFSQLELFLRPSCAVTDRQQSHRSKSRRSLHFCSCNLHLEDQLEPDLVRASSP